ncbi:DUF2730 domain-containing protein [Hoeflea sp. WL0058]|uniref:DUF2730 domain-containing protein n=1 Tax=Flavimaribacter sediminis TaxID=2865987 RepID=A0AAE2ZML5_9HYPH|nr:DUF2730 family protein [Flavimaribacter sediminis]MBW8638981.1 DUF2730 domain-containing protein [Flavimaribacter sediminis]
MTQTLPELIAPWLGLIALFISVGGTVYAWLTSRSKEYAKKLDNLNEGRAKDLSEINTRLNGHASRIQTIEDEMKHLPDRDSQHRVELALAEMNGRFAALDEKLKPIASTSQRLSEFLLEQAKKS